MSVIVSGDLEPNLRPRRFVSTRWSLVLATRDLRSARARTALATLCETYWSPVYAFIRHSGHSGEEARDMTQAFFTRVLEKGSFGDARPERGRFRAFLLGSVRHFLANQHDRECTRKRGGGVVHVPLGLTRDDRTYTLEPADDETPESLYERRWALAVLEDALARVKAQQARRGQREQFEQLRPFLTGDGPSSYQEMAAKLRVSEGSLRVAVHRLRQQFGNCLREAIAQTVAHPGNRVDPGDPRNPGNPGNRWNSDEVEDELRHLLAVVSR